jgi:hypothetical protein
MEIWYLVGMTRTGLLLGSRKDKAGSKKRVKISFNRPLLGRLKIRSWLGRRGDRKEKPTELIRARS